MDVQVNDILVMKKEHPCGEKRFLVLRVGMDFKICCMGCGAKQWLVLRSGMDFRLRCTGCGHELMIPRSKAEKSIRQILRGGKPI